MPGCSWKRFKPLTNTKMPDPIDYRALLTTAYQEIKSLRSRLDSPGRPEGEPIAIVGAGCRFPQAPDAEAYWHLLREGRDAITEVPATRWNSAAYYDKNPGTERKTYSRWGGFLENPDQFDPHFFDISPREASLMDPQQRIFLEVAWETLEDAGYGARRLEKQHVGVYVGCSNNQYYRLIEPALTSLDHSAGIGNQNPIIANRISFLLNLSGPSVLVDTMCSSSLVALDMACQALRQGNCTMALVGGVNMLLSPEYYVAMSRMRMHAPDGRCKAFDHRADGIVLGEGAGAVLLKPLRTALAEGDSIRAVIKGSAINHGGAANGITAPNPAAQSRVIARALQAAGVGADSITWVETHGTGTALGDPIEIEGLTKAFRRHTDRKQYCAIGSVKTNIGHLEPAAGIAQVIKVVLAMEHKQLPPSLHFESPNPHIAFADTPFKVNTALTPWQTSSPRRAGVSSFGIGGTNAHVILEEAPETAAPPDQPERPLHICTISAKSRPALEELAGRYEKRMNNALASDFASLSFSSNTGRNHFAHRIALVAGGPKAAAAQLAAAVAGNEAGGLFRSQAGDQKESPSVTFLFTGQGAQYPGMGKALFETNPVFRRVLLQCDDILRQYLDIPLPELLFSPAAAQSHLHETAYTQPALFAFEYALASVWLSWGINPRMVIGHSVGEYAAACVAGVFSLEDGLKLMAARGRLMQALPANGRMMAVFTPLEEVLPALYDYEGEVSVAAVNGPAHVVVSGRATAVEALKAYFESKGGHTRFLTVSHAFHSPLVKPMLDDFAAVLSQISFSRPRLKIISNITGELIDEEITTPGYWCRHVLAPVNFSKGIGTAAARGGTIFLEIGPGTTLVAMGKAALPGGANVLWLPSLQKNKADWEQVLNSLAELYVQGIDVDWPAFDQPYHRRRVPLPKYPFQRQRYWVEPVTPVPAAATNPVAGPVVHPLLGRPRETLANQTHTWAWEAEVSGQTHAFLGNHQIGNTIIMPFAAYVEMALAAAEAVLGEKTFALAEMTLPAPLLVPADNPVLMQSVLKRGADGLTDFCVYTRPTGAPGTPSPWSLHARVTIVPKHQMAAKTSNQA